MTGVLYVCAVPIGQIEDASSRLKTTFEQVDVIACEDTRVTGKLLERLNIGDRPRLLAHHQHNELASAEGIVSLLDAGQNVALVSDAGTPAISDPGATLVRLAHEAGHRVSAVAGPSALAVAVSVSGALGGSAQVFCGFLPRSKTKLRELVLGYANEVVVAFESPRRLRDSLVEIEHVQPERTLTVCRELTKPHEQVVRGSIQLVLNRLIEPVRGEVVLVLDPLETCIEGQHEAAMANERRSLDLARELVSKGLSVKDAARISARHLGGKPRSIYDQLVSRENSE